MALNFLGLGFSFGAKDTGLGSFLQGVDQQFQQMTETLKGLYSVADQAPQMPGAAAMSGASMGGDAFAAAAEAASGLGDMGDAAQAVEGVAEASDAASAATDAMSTLGDAGAMSGKMLSGGAFKAVGALGRVAGAAGIVGMAIGPVVSGLGEAVNAVQGFGESVAMALPNMVQRGIRGIQRMNEGINLTNSLEAEAQGLSVSARALGANMGYTGDQLSRFTGRATSMAMALNMGSDSTAKAIRAWDEAGTELRALGFEGAADVARFTEAFGVDADTLRNTTMQMTREFGLTTDQIHELVSSQVAMGQATGDVAGALGQLPQMMEQMRSRAAMMGESLDGAELAAHARSASALAAGFFQLGQDSDQAREAALSLSGAMMESRRQFQNMFAGTADELPQFAQEIAIATGDVGTAFEAMQQGPDEFMRGMAGLVQQTRENGGNVGRLMEFMRARFSEAVGPEQADQMVNFFRNATPEILNMMSATAGASRNLGEMAREAHRTGRTLQESFDRALEGAQTALRGVTRRETVQFVRNTSREMRRLGQSFREIGEQGGAMGGIVRMMSRTAQLGQLGLVPERFQTTAVMANQIHENMQPLINSLTSFGGLVDFAATQAILFGTRMTQNWDAAEASVRAAARATGEAVTDEAIWRAAFDITANEFADEWIATIERIGPIIENLIQGFAEIDWATLFTPTTQQEGGMASGAMGAVQRVIRALGEIDWSGMWDNLQQGFGRLWDAIQPWVAQTWKEFKDYIVGQVDESFGAFLQRIQQWWDANWIDIVGMVSLGATALGAAIVVGLVAGIVLLPVIIGGIMGAGLGWFTARYIEPWLNDMWDQFKETVIDPIKQGWHDMWTAIGRWVGEGVSRIIRLVGRIRATFDRVVDGIRGVFNGLQEFFQFHVDFVYNLFTGSWSAIGDQLSSVIGGVREFMAPFFEWLGTAWTSISESVTGIWDTISTNIEGAFDRIRGAVQPLRDAINTVSNFFTTVWENIGTVIEGVVTRVGNFFRELGSRGMSAITGIIDLARGAFSSSMNTYIRHDVGRSVEEFERLQNAGETALNAVLGTAEDVYGHSMNSVLQEGFGQEVRAVAEVASEQSAMDRRASLADQGTLLHATHYPEWYTSDFKRLYDTRMDDLISAVRESARMSREEAPRQAAARRVRAYRATRPERGLPGVAASPAGMRA